MRVGSRRRAPQLTPPSTARICPVMCLPAATGEQQRGALQVVVVADALAAAPARPACRRRSRRARPGHLAREEARRQRVDGDAVARPTRRPACA